MRAFIRKILDRRRGRVYTHIVSLGGSCRPSYQIARHFSVKVTYPFDGWLTPLDSAAFYIEKLDEDLYDPSCLSARVRNGRIQTIMNTKFQIRLFHDFERGGAHAEVLPNWESGIETARSRTRYLVDKLQALNQRSNHVLFVRLSDSVSNHPLLDRRLTRRQAAEHLLAALRARFNWISFDLMCVSFESRSSRPDSSVMYIDMIDPADQLDAAVGWKGTDSLWSGAFNQIDARLEPPRKPSIG